MSKDDQVIVSEQLLYWAADPAGLPHVDVEEDEYPELHFPGMDVNNPEEVKERVIRPFIVPYMRMWDLPSQRLFRDSFQYYLNFKYDIDGPSGGTVSDSELFRRVLGSATVTFEYPTPARLFFVWIWEEVFGPDDYHLDSTSNFLIDNDRRYYVSLQPDNTYHLTLITEPFSLPTSAREKQRE